VAAAIGLVFWPRPDVLALTSGLHVSFRPASVGPGSRLLFLQEDLSGGMTTVIENPPRAAGGAPVRILLADGKFQGEDGANQAAQVLLGLLPVAYRPQARSALVIGLGTGQSAEVLASAGVAGVVAAEIAPGIREASRRFFGAVHGDLFQRPGVTIVLEDGRNLLQRSPRAFDIVATQVNSAWFAGAGSLYSREFYELARRRMETGAIFEQWVPLHHVGPEDVASAVATLESVFPHAVLWQLADQGYLLASAAPLELSIETLRRFAFDPSLSRHAAALEAASGRPLSEIGALLLLDEAAAARLSREVARRGLTLSTDANRSFEYAAARGAVGPSGRTPEIVEGLRAMAGAN
jgi:spermidine synthase